MSFDPISAAFDLGRVAIERIFPDKAQRAEQMLKLEALKQEGKLAELHAYVQLLVGQMEINKSEAQHSSVFVSGWRPGCGWVCVIGLFYTFLLRPLLQWGSGMFAEIPPPPELDMGDLLTLLLGMLGIGSMRTLEKFKGVETKSLGAQK